MSLIRGRRYNRLKKAPGGQIGNNNRAKREPQNEGVVSAQDHHSRTAQTLAAQHGVSRATIESYGADAALLDAHPEVAATTNENSRSQDIWLRLFSLGSCQC